MRSLILGAGGQVGRALVRSAPSQASVVAMSRSECDITSPSAVTAAIARSGADLVFNAAGYTAVDRAEAEPEEAMRINGQAPGQIAQACAAAGARLVHLSSDFVFDGSKSEPYRPGDPARPLSVYGRSKREGELAVLAALPDALIVRTAWVYAADGKNFLRTMLRLMAQPARVRVVADQVGTPTWAEALARSLWGLADAGASGLHHYTDAGVASWYDFAMAIAEEAAALGLLKAPTLPEPIGTADYPTPAHRPPYSVLDKTETWQLLGGAAAHWRANLRTCLGEMTDHA